MSKVASSASQAGVPLERMEAIITVTADQTQQAAETIGRAWNSILQRMNKISAGKDVSDTGKSLNDVDKALKTVGISLRDENGIIKDSSGLLDEIAAKWDTWNRNQQNQIATAVAGTNQANVFRSTISDYKEVLEATTIAENANGSATERMAIYTESLTAKINTFKTAWTELVNDLNLDEIIGFVVDIGTKAIEFLNILLNKIPVLSSALKTIITVQGINILVGAIVKAVAKITGTNGIAGILQGFINLKDSATVLKGALSGVAVSTEGMGVAAKSLSSMLALANSAATALGITLGGLLGILGGVAVVVAAIGAAGYWLWSNNSIDGKLKNANSELEEAQNSLEETSAKLEEIKTEREELLSAPEDQLTKAEKDRLEFLNEQYDAYDKILKKKQEIVDLDQKEVNDLEAQKRDKNYTNYNSYDSAVTSYNDVNSMSGASSATDIYSGNNFATYLVQLENLKKIQADIMAGNNQYGMSIEEVNKKIDECTGYLDEQVVSLQEDKAWYEQTGETASAGYAEVSKQLQIFDSLMNSAKWEDSMISQVVDIDQLQQNLDDAQAEVEKAQSDLANGVEGATEETVAKAGEAAKEKTEQIMKDTVNSAAETIMNDSGLRKAAEIAFNIDLSTLDGYIRLKEILSEDIPKAYSDAMEAANGMTEEQLAMKEALSTHSGALAQYASDVEAVTEKQKILNTAYSEMREKGQLTVSTMNDLIAQCPELANKITVVDGVIKVETNSLQDLSDKYYDTAIAQYQFQLDSVNDATTGAISRIKAYGQEMAVLDQLMAKMKEKDQSEWTTQDWDQYKGMQRTKYQLTKDQKQVDWANEVQGYIDSLEKLKSQGLTYTPKSTKKTTSGGTKTDPDKEAHDLKKSELGVIQDKLELQKSILEQSKKEKEQEKKGLEIQKSELELKKKQKEQQLDIIQDAEDGIDDIIELIKKMTKQDYENLKTKLGEIKDYIGDFKDALDDVKDTYDDIVDDAKDKLKAEKEAADNQKKLEEGAKSIAEIQAQLAEIQYDDSADAQAKRLELTASLNEKQQDLEDEMKDQAYDAATDALDKTKDKVDDIFDAIGEILDASQDAIEDYVDYISDTLESEGNLYKAAVEQFNDTSEGAQDALYQRLMDWNDQYGSAIKKDVEEPWKAATEAVKEYNEAVGSMDIDKIRQYLGSKDSELTASIKLDEQSIDALDNQIDQIQIDMDKVDQQITQFEQAITQVKNALKQLDIDYNQKENAEDAGTTDPTKTGTDYAYGLMRKLLSESGVDVSQMPATWTEFQESLQKVTETANTTSESLEGLGDTATTTTEQVEDEGDTHADTEQKVDDAGQTVADTEQPLTDLQTSADGAADALGGIEQAATTGDTGSGFNIGKAAQFLIGGDWESFTKNFATKAISKYLPKLIKAGVSAIGKLHDGTSEVTKSNSWLDNMLGLGSDETARILKVGEAVIPDYANDAINRGVATYGTDIKTPDTSNIRTTNNSELNIDMGDLDISGIDTTELRNELQNIKKESANQVYSTLYRYIKVGGYRNVKNRYN